MNVHWTKIQEIIEEAPGVKTFLLERPQDFHWQPGAHTHFAMKGFNDGEKPDRSLVRHMSISTLETQNQIGITTKIHEICSKYKEVLKNGFIGMEVGLFGTSTNVPLRREGRPIYLLSSGVGLATFKPLILDYLEEQTHIPFIQSLNIESSGNFLFPELFEQERAQLVATHVTTRQAYYEQVDAFATDKNGLFYIVGSDEFLHQTIAHLKDASIDEGQIIIDKHPRRIPEFLVTRTYAE